jgi:tRNA-Thr(GGU) m(6)t(6)A37 methyltransferase TsaA
MTSKVQPPVRSENDERRDDVRPGEICLPFDPAAIPGDARVVFIGRIRSPWPDRAACPKNLREARERFASGARPRPKLEIDAPYRAGLAGLAGGAHVIVLAWLHQVRRDVIVQAPRHLDATKGVFALRTPLRPNPIAMDVVAITALDPEAGIVEIDAIDLVDGTPLVDVKPWLASVDVVPPEDRPTVAKVS